MRARGFLICELSRSLDVVDTHELEEGGGCDFVRSGEVIPDVFVLFDRVRFTVFNEDVILRTDNDAVHELVWQLDSSFCQQLDKAHEFAVVRTLQVPIRKVFFLASVTDDGKVAFGGTKLGRYIAVLLCCRDHSVTVEVEEEFCNNTVRPDGRQGVGLNHRLERQLVLQCQGNSQRNELLELVH